MLKKPFSLHVDMDAFIPATESEKEYMVQMRPASTFFKDGVKRLRRNKVATVSFFIVLIITLTSILLPIFWPYSYSQQLGVRPGKPVDASYNNLAPFEYGETEQKKIDAGEKVSPTSSAPTPPAGTTSSALSTAPASPWPWASSPASSC